MTVRADYFSQDLNYSLGEEDTGLEAAVLPDGVGHVVVVAGSGSRVLPLFARSPAAVTCVDLSPLQVALTELRIEAARFLSYEEFIGLLGYPPSSLAPLARRAVFARVPLTPVTRRLLTSLFDRHGWTEVIYLGRFEGMLRTLATANRVITRRAGAGLFDCDSLEEQRQYLAERFPHRRWRWLVRLLASAPTLNALLYRGAFPRRNIAMTAGEFFLNAFDRVFHTHVVKTTTFVQMLFFGRIRYPEGNPYEAQAHRFASIQDGARRATVKYVLDDAVRAVATSALPVDFVSLSDVPSFFKPPRERSFLQDLAEGVRPGGRVVVRGNLRVARPDPSGFGPDSDRFRDIIAQENTGIWHVQIYRRLQNTLAQSP